MGSVSRTWTCCQEKNVRMRGKYEKKESKERGVTIAYCQSGFYEEHSIFHLLQEI